MVIYDVAVIGAGASGLMAAARALYNGRSVLVLDAGNVSGRKISVSGGGHCNITNTAAKFGKYFGKNPNFVRSALAQFTPSDMINWADIHGIELYQKTAGRYFCKSSASDVVAALLSDITDAKICYNTCVTDISKNSNNIFCINTKDKAFYATSVIVATGGVSYPVLGVSDVGYNIAKKFGHKIIPVRPALCPIRITNNPFIDFSGISIPATIKIAKNTVDDDLLFTHMGIGGPAAYRASLYDISKGIYINMLPNINIFDAFSTAKKNSGRKQIISILSEYLPNRIAKYIANNDTRNIADIKDTELKQIAEQVHNIYLSGDLLKYHNMSAAEVTFGGISTDEISSKTMESKLCPGLYFTGEVLDITGDLGGFNLHWAWASGFVAGNNA